jgi:hypothetical protein
LIIINLDNLTATQNALLNDIAVNVRTNFHLLMEEIARGNEHKLNWIVSNVASRNKYNSPLFIRCCQLSLIKQIVDTKNSYSVITSDYSLAKVLNNHYQDIEVSVDITCTETTLSRIKRYVVPIKLYFDIIIDYIERFIYRSNFVKNNPGLDKTIPLTLLDNFVIQSETGEPGSIYNGEYIDRYYTGLLDNLSKSEQKDIYYLPTPIGFKNSRDAFNVMRGSTTNIIIRDDFLTLPDYLEALMHPFRLFAMQRNQIFHAGMNITPIIRQETYYTCCNSNCLEAILFYRFAYRLAKSEVKIRLVIEWYENQVIDKGSILGFHHYFSKVPVIGYQGYIISRVLHHYIYPTDLEKRTGVVPDKIAVIGKNLISDVLEFCNTAEVITAPAFRNQNVWAKRTHFPANEEYTVLVALPLDRREIVSILQRLIKARNLAAQPKTKYWIKPHPTYSVQDIKSMIQDSFEGFTFVTGDFKEILEQSNLLIGNASITSVEAIALGIPVVIIGDKNGVIQNPIPKSVPESIWRTCFTAKDISDGIMHYMYTTENDNREFREIGELVKQNYFEENTIEKSRKFLLLDRTNE